MTTECVFCNGSMEVAKLTEKQLYEIDDVEKYCICEKHQMEILDKIARGDFQ